MMNFRISTNHGAMEATISGQMYVEDAARFREEALVAMGEDVRNVVVDLTHLQYIDSAGMGVLISLHKRCLKRGGNFVVKGLSGTVKELFELTRLTKIFTIS